MTLNESYEQNNLNNVEACNIFEFAVERFELRTASSQTALMTQFDSCTLIETIPGRAPGQYVESVELPITVDPMYYAVKAVYKNMKVNIFATSNVMHSLI